MKYGLMVYNYTTNLGNEIQSIAARRFLPQIDFCIDHEKLNSFKNPQKVDMIMNGWYLDCLKSWPPSDSINPLLISMHFNSSFNKTRKVISSPQSKDFFSTYGPVGCRDEATLDLLAELDIDGYYSGCLTLTLQGNNDNENDYKYIVVNSIISDEIIDFLKEITDMDIYNVSQDIMWSYDKKYLDTLPKMNKLNSFFNADEKMFLAENLLKLYENAHCVITDRVHCAFPCLALKTPVLFINSAKFGLERLSGIEKLLLTSSFEEYKNDYKIFDVENPPKNPDNYLKIRKSLIKKTKAFTGHLSESYDSNLSSQYIFNNHVSMLTKAGWESRKYINNVIKLSKNYETKIVEQNKIINEQKKLIDEMNNSGSWKLSKSLKKLTKR